MIPFFGCKHNRRELVLRVFVIAVTLLSYYTCPTQVSGLGDRQVLFSPQPQHHCGSGRIFTVYKGIRAQMCYKDNVVLYSYFHVRKNCSEMGPVT